MSPFSNNDTIAAVATAPGAGGVGIVRLSGPASLGILQGMFQPASGKADWPPRLLRYGRVLDAAGQVLDEALAVYFPDPHSFTGEDVVEIQGHGGTAVLQAVLNEALDRGARLATGGEFTRRAFLNGRMDLTQAEAVAEIIAAPGLEGVRLAGAKLDGLLGKRIGELRDKLEYLRQRICLAIDFPDEEAECLPRDEFLALVREVEEGISTLLAGYRRARSWREGALVVLSGRVNSGKSSLMNALLGRNRAIVTDKPGTTRDYLEESLSLDGLPVRLVDTAGLRRDSPDPIEMEGMRLGRELAGQAQAVLILLDGGLAFEHKDLKDLFAPEAALAEELGPQRCLMLWNKADLCPAPAQLKDFFSAPLLEISARGGQGLEQLATAVRGLCASASPAPDELAPNLRQSRQLEKARAELEELEKEIAANIPPDLCGLRLESAAVHLADITGLNSAEDTLNAIFEDFCIGK